jgi:hypothetical protein
MGEGRGAGAGLSDLDHALQAARNGDLTAARALLEVPESDLSDPELLAALNHLNQAMRLGPFGDRPVEADQAFDRADPVLRGEASLSRFLRTVARFYKGASLLHQGDGHGATRLLQESAEELQQFAFTSPELERLAHRAQIAFFVAELRRSLNGNDMPAARAWMDRVTDAQERLLATLDPEDDTDADAYLEIYGTALEFSTSLAFLEVQAFSFDTAARLLRQGSDAARQTPDLLSRRPSGTLPSLVAALLHMRTALEKIVPAARRITSGRSPSGRETLSDLEEALDEIHESQGHARAGLEQGKGYVSMAERLKTLCVNLIESGRVRKGDWGRVGGPIAAIVFGVLVVLVATVAKPTGLNAGLLYSSCLVVALVAGFGFGALRFRPLLQMQSDLLKQWSEGDDA